MSTYPNNPEVIKVVASDGIDAAVWNAVIDNINAIADDLVLCRSDDQAFPGTDHTADQCATMDDIFQAIKHMLSELTGNDNWYDDFFGSLEAHTHIVDSGGLIPFGSLGADDVRIIVLEPPYNRMYTYKLRGAAASGANTITLSMDQYVASGYIAHNYYEGISAEGTLQDVYVAIRFTLPVDFGAWSVNEAIKVGFQTGVATVSDSHVDVYIYKSGVEAQVASSEDNASINWSEAVIDGSALGTWAVNNIIEIYLKLESKDSNFARIGKVTFNYTA